MIALGVVKISLYLDQDKIINNHKQALQHGLKKIIQ